jgi:hypothetical protein
MIAISRFAGHLMIHRNEALEAGLRVERIDDTLKRLDELQKYALLNQRSLVDYARAWRKGERVSTAHVESTMNLLVNQRTGKKQQMRWSRRGAQLLLHVSTALLNGRPNRYTGLPIPAKRTLVNDHTRRCAA